MCFLASFLNLLVTLLKVRLAHRYLRHGRKVGSSPGAPGPLIPKYPQYLRIPLTTVTPRTSGPSDSLEPEDPWEITYTIWNPEFKHSEDLKLKHKQMTFLNYIIGQSKWKIACTFWGYFIYRDFIYLTVIIRGQSPPLLPSSYVSVINRNDNQWILALQHSCLYSLVVTCNLAYSHLYHW